MSTVTCKCGKAYQVSADNAGKRFKCRECGASLQVPAKGAVSTDDRGDLGGGDARWESEPSARELPPRRPRRSAGNRLKKRSPQSAGGSRIPLILGVSGAAVVLIGCVAIGAYFVFSGADDPIEVATTDFGTRSDDGPAASEAVEGDGRAEPATTSTEAASEAPEVSASNAAPAEPGGEDASPTAAESASAILELRSLGVRFEYVEEYGGRLADFGLILGDFDNEKLRLLHVMPDQDPVVAVRLPPAVTDDALDHVIGLERVTVLAILGDNVTGEGLRKLTQMTWLKQLIVWSNQVTQNDIDELKGSLPDCEIRLLRP